MELYIRFLDYAAEGQWFIPSRALRKLFVLFNSQILTLALNDIRYLAQVENDENVLNRRGAESAEFKNFSVFSAPLR
jgi:hypothetical protein